MSTAEVTFMNTQLPFVHGIQSKNKVGKTKRKTSLSKVNAQMLPSDTEPFENQVAGHMHETNKSIGLFKHKDGYVMKPIIKQQCGEREIWFYEYINATPDPVLLQMKEFIPQYYGTRTLKVNNKDVTCIMLDNLVKGLKEPCIMDVKIGRRTWDPLATEEKRLKEQSKYKDSKQTLGFCITGFQVVNIADDKVYRYGKDYGKKLNKETVKDAFGLFLNAESGLNRQLLLQLLSPLWRIHHWCRSQKKLHLYSSSVLLYYDAKKLRQRVISKELKAPKRPVIKHDISVPPTVNDVPNKYISKFERSLSTKYIDLPLSSPMKVNGSWQETFEIVKKTHSFTNNYEDDLANMKQSYTYMLEELVSSEDKDDLWATAKMIDFAHTFPAETAELDENYLEGIENLVKMLEGFLESAEKL